METKKVKIKYVWGLPYIVEDRTPIIGDIVVEELMTGIFDLFQIDTLNDIDTKTQWPILVKPEDIKYHWIPGQVMHDHVYDFYKDGTVEEIYDKVNTLKDIQECEVLSEKTINGKIILKLNGQDI
jgi:hypothetical protein